MITYEAKNSHIRTDGDDGEVLRIQDQGQQATPKSLPTLKEIE